MQKRILAIALNPAIDVSCDAEHVRPTLKTRTANQKHYAGGGGANVARVIAELGGRAELVYLSGGISGPLYDSLLDQYDIVRHRIEMAGSNRIALMVHETSTNFEYRFVPEGPTVSPEELLPVHDFVENFEGDYIVASGSLPLGAPPDTYRRMADTARRKNIRFVLDTSGEALRQTVDHAEIFLLKPSMSELEKLVGERLDERIACEAASELVRRGSVQNIALSMGKAGAILVNADGMVRMRSVHVREASAVGAGDSFVAGMVWWLSQGHPVIEAFRFGIAAGSAAVMTPGTELCRREDVFALYENGVTSVHG
ncbi:1-phosphofructokinase family hexose kinase [Oricola thermophila]|uniref:Phosphofructokinase n=1 Tax=Oricola thermophila TaxID=2742145 RepID=A0A6N1VB50_9HYPH|nr:1-phosphofructokinase family hexose kinase [Oricola thermophila]QKV18140.1 1-phosphofructokinase family hexose kinase [Oricola thermophila]